MITEYVKKPAKPVRAVRLHSPPRLLGPAGLAAWTNTQISKHTMNLTPVNRTSIAASPASRTSLNDRSGRPPAVKHRAAARPIKATPAARDGRLPKPMLRPECCAVLGGMLDLFDLVRADGWPLQRAAGQLEPAGGLLPDAESVGEFVREHLIAAAGSMVTVKEAFSAYRTYCTSRRLPRVNRTRFDRLIEDAVAQHLHLRLRHDIPVYKGSPQQGWKGAKLV